LGKVLVLERHNIIDSLGDLILNKSYSYRLNDLFEELVAGKYHEVIDEAEKILQNDKTNVETRIEAMLAKSWSLFRLANFEFRGDYKEQALEEIKEAHEKSLVVDNVLLMFDTIFLKILSLSQNNKHEEIIANVEKARDIYEKLIEEFPQLSREKKAFLLVLDYFELFHKESIIEDYSYDFQESISYLNQAFQLNVEYRDKGFVLNRELNMILLFEIFDSYSRINDSDKAVEHLQNAIDFAAKNKNEYWKSYFLQFIGRQYWISGEFDLFHEFTLKSREISEKIGNIRGIGSAHHNLGMYYNSIGDWKRGLEHSLKAFDILSKDGLGEKSTTIARLLNNIGVCYYNQGEFDKALTHYDMAIEHNTKMGEETLVHLNHNNKAIIHRERGELDIALKIYEEISQYSKRRGFKEMLSKSIWNISSVYQAKGLFNKAHDKLEETLKLLDEIGNTTDINSALYSLVLLSVKFDKLQLAKEYFAEFEKRADKAEYKITKQQIMLAEAAILARSSVARDRVRAEVIYDQLLKEQLVYNVHLGIIFHLCELLLSELKESSDERILVKLQKYVNKMIELSTKNHISALLVESLWFKAQLSLLNLDFEKAKELLSQALNLAEEKGLNRLSLKIMKSKEQLVQQLVELEDLEKESPTISKRMETIKIENDFKEITNSQMFQFKQNI